MISSLVFIEVHVVLSLNCVSLFHVIVLSFGFRVLFGIYIFFYLCTMSIYYYYYVTVIVSQPICIDMYIA